MQSCTLVSVGKLSASYFKDAANEYEKRLQAFCSFKSIEIPEEKIDEKQMSDAVVQKALAKEGQKIIAALPPKAQVVALCVEGKPFTSEELATLLNTNAAEKGGQIAFIIGSSHGLAESVKQKASVKLSVSSMTLPHQLCRVLLTEQIYRGYTILAGKKYHK